MCMCVYRRKFTRAAFKYAMIGRGGGPTTGVRCRITTAAATRPSRDNHRRRFRIQSAEFMRASQLDTRPVLFHGNVITRGAGRIRGLVYVLQRYPTGSQHRVSRDDSAGLRIPAVGYGFLDYRASSFHGKIRKLRASSTVETPRMAVSTIRRGRIEIRVGFREGVGLKG